MKKVFWLGLVVFVLSVSLCACNNKSATPKKGTSSDKSGYVGTPSSTGSNTKP